MTYLLHRIWKCLEKKMVILGFFRYRIVIDILFVFVKKINDSVHLKYMKFDKLNLLFAHCVEETPTKVLSVLCCPLF